MHSEYLFWCETTWPWVFFFCKCLIGHLPKQGGGDCQWWKDARIWNKMGKRINGSSTTKRIASDVIHIREKVFASLNAWIKSLLEASFCLSMTLREQHIGRSPKAPSVEAILGAERRRRRDYNSAPVLLSDYRQTNPLIGPNLLPHSGVLKGRGRIFAFWKRKNISRVWEIAVLASSPPLRRNLEIKGGGGVWHHRPQLRWWDTSATFQAGLRRWCWGYLSPKRYEEEGGREVVVIFALSLGCWELPPPPPLAPPRDFLKIFAPF